MKRLLLAAAFAAVAAVPAVAADMPVKARPAPAAEVAVFSWTGFYVGVHGGIGWGKHDRSTGSFNNSYESNGVLLGGQGGYNWQFNPFVLGIEADGAWTRIRGNDAAAGGTTDASRFQWLASVRGRLGFAWNRVLVYGTGGWAWTSVRHTNLAGAPSSNDSGLDGWTAGGGAEFAIADNWSLGVEYRYYNFDQYSLAPGGLAAFTVDNRLQTLTARLNYKFNWGAPVVARY